MIRGTTPTHTFTFDKLDPSTFKVMNVYYAQQGKQTLEKTKEDFTFGSRETECGLAYFASVTLSQEDTLSFNPKHNVKVQLRVLTADDRALATKEYELSVWDVINDEVLE